MPSLQSDNEQHSDNQFSPLLASPFAGLQRVTDDMLLIETRVEVESDVAIFAKKVDQEAFALLLYAAEHKQLLADRKASCKP